jgi:hypothetical protein
VIDPEQLEEKKAAKRAYVNEWSKAYRKTPAFKAAQDKYRFSEHGIAKRRAQKLKPESKATAAARHAERGRVLNEMKVTAGCIDCGFNAHPAALEFDHVRGEKLGNVSTIRNRAWHLVLAEIAKCDVRCSNCHRIKTAEDGWK